jgi:hypothetical protein
MLNDLQILVRGAIAGQGGGQTFPLAELCELFLAPGPGMTNEPKQVTHEEEAVRPGLQVKVVISELS